MFSFLRNMLILLTVVSIGAIAQGQTVLYDFDDPLGDPANEPFGHFGTVTTDSGLFQDNETPGNFYATHTGRFTELSTNPHEIGMIEIGPFTSSPKTIDMTPYVGYSIDARFIRDTDGLGGAGEEMFTGHPIIKFGVQWDTTNGCNGTMNQCSDLYDTPVELTEEFQTYTVMFDDFLQGKPRNAVQIKMLMLTGDFDPDALPNRKFDSADFDASFSVDGADYLTWQRSFGTAGVPAGYAEKFIDGNANYDDVFDGDDLAIWESQFGVPAPTGDWSNGIGRLEYDNIIGILPSASSAANAVPEPSTCWLILCCGSLLTWKTRFRS